MERVYILGRIRRISILKMCIDHIRRIPFRGDFLSHVETQLVNAESAADVVETKQWMKGITEQFLISPQLQALAQKMVAACLRQIVNRRSLPSNTTALYDLMNQQSRL